jgi:hypothetical protein
MFKTQVMPAAADAVQLLAHDHDYGYRLRLLFMIVRSVFALAKPVICFLWFVGS